MFLLERLKRDNDKEAKGHAYPSAIKRCRSAMQAAEER